MKTRLLSSRDLEAIVARVGIDALMDEAIRRLNAALASFDPSRTDIPIRTGFNYEEPMVGLVEWMPLHERDAVTIKIVGYHPSSPERFGVPTVLSTLSRYDTRTGHLEALVDGTFLTAIRTGAASAVATRILARPDSATLGLVGVGAQAVTQLHALSRVLPIRRILLHDVDAAAEASFAGRIAAFADPAWTIESASLPLIVAESDVISVATSVDVGGGPVLPDGPSKPWLHINAVGSDFPGKVEVPRSMLERAFVCPDTLGQATREGECQQLDDLEGVVELPEVARQPDRFASSAREQISVFDSTGWALEDRVMIEMALEYAASFGLGTDVEVETVTADPRDPYEFVADRTAAGDGAPENLGSIARP